jgi:2,3-bisphosphoglycerate-independent phosphoglycerate mutase
MDIRYDHPQRNEAGMKYLVILGDGMADYPVAELGGKTPLQAARKPRIDSLARRGEMGMVKTVPEGLPPASDVANLSVMGYDPAKYYTGRSPIEAVSMGIDLAPTDVAFRCNLVSLSPEGNFASKVMLDYSSDEIPTDEARVLVEEVQRRLGTGKIAFHPGISYRHCMVWKGGPSGCELTPPHDIPLKPIREHLPKGEAGDRILRLMEAGHEILRGHPINEARKARGELPANSIWLWGQGRKPAIPLFSERHGLRGSVISAVDLIKGLGICAGMRSIDVEGATGNIHTNFAGKAEAALRELESGQDFVYVHIEAPDECGHHHEIEDKVRSIELIDELVVGRLLDGMAGFDGYRILVLPDHPTPLSIRTHTSDAVPFLIHEKGKDLGSGLSTYDEIEAKKSGLFVDRGHELMDRFLLH